MSKPWKRNGSRVYGQGQSYNCTNNVTAIELQTTLNNYETTFSNLQSTSEKLHNIERQLIQIQLSLGILTNDIEKLKEVMTK